MGSVLALDIAGSMTGWAMASVDAKPAPLPLEGQTSPMPECGRRGFAGGAGGDMGLQFFLFDDWLRKKIDDNRVQVLVFEAPLNMKMSRGINAARLQLGLAAICELVAKKRRVEHVFELHVSTIKKHAGSGRFKKADMLAAARARWGDAVKDHNVADALFTLDYALLTIQRWRDEGKWTLEDAA